MSIFRRNNVRILSAGSQTMVLAHGYGCDQNMWRLLLPTLAERYRIVLYDLTGCGHSDLGAYDRARHGSLHGHAQDLLEIVREVAAEPVIFVGHSVSAMIGLLAGIEEPARFSHHVMIGPSACYVNDGDYVGGFTREDIDSLLDTLDSNYLGWASTMAPVIMGAPEQPELGQELANSFCATDPEIAKHFARVTFTSDNRSDVSKLSAPVLVLQCSDDIIAPLSAGQYLHAELPHSQLRIIENIGHCPHLSSPAAIAAAIHAFL